MEWQVHDEWESFWNLSFQISYLISQNWLLGTPQPRPWNQSLRYSSQSCGIAPPSFALFKRCGNSEFGFQRTTAASYVVVHAEIVWLRLLWLRLTRAKDCHQLEWLGSESVTLFSWLRDNCTFTRAIKLTHSTAPITTTRKTTVKPSIKQVKTPRTSIETQNIHSSPATRSK